MIIKYFLLVKLTFFFKFQKHLKQLKAAIKTFQDWQKLKRSNFNNIVKIAQLRKREEKLNNFIVRLQEEISTLRSEVDNLNSYIASELCETVMFHEGEEEEEEEEEVEQDAEKVEVEK